ncbi:hypothetical protein GCM10020255_098710 [Rhodococcus baikonurensis]
MTTPSDSTVPTDSTVQSDIEGPESTESGSVAVTTTTKGLSAEAERRRTFAVISHPDAGKSTLTEALALHAKKISEAGAVHGKAGRKSTVSDWMEMEKARGISVSSTALQFNYHSSETPDEQINVINLVDTPGHSDFSEDTYRVLTAVDAAVMLIDAAKGLEPQTLKLFQVCRHRGIPVITVINKWDRPGQTPLELLDEISERIGLTPTPCTGPSASPATSADCCGAAKTVRLASTSASPVPQAARRSPPKRSWTPTRRSPRKAPSGRPRPRRVSCSPLPARTTIRRCSSPVRRPR